MDLCVLDLEPPPPHLLKARYIIFTFHFPLSWHLREYQEVSDLIQMFFHSQGYNLSWRERRKAILAPFGDSVTNIKNPVIIILSWALRWCTLHQLTPWFVTTMEGDYEVEMRGGISTTIFRWGNRGSKSQVTFLWSYTWEQAELKFKHRTVESQQSSQVHFMIQTPALIIGFSPSLPGDALASLKPSWEV